MGHVGRRLRSCRLVCLLYLKKLSLENVLVLDFFSNLQLMDMLAG